MTRARTSWSGTLTGGCLGADTLNSMIAGGVDRAAFDERCRAPVLNREIGASPLVVERRVIQFPDVNST